MYEPQSDEDSGDSDSFGSEDEELEGMGLPFFSSTIAISHALFFNLPEHTDRVEEPPEV